MRKNRDYELFEKARDLYSNETDVVKILRQLRLVRRAVEKVVPEKEMKEIEKDVEMLDISTADKEQEESHESAIDLFGQID